MSNETINGLNIWSNGPNNMPKLTPQQARELRVALGRELPGDIAVMNDGIPQDVAVRINAVQQENVELRTQVSDLMKTVQDLLAGLSRVNAAPVTQTKPVEKPARAKKPISDDTMFEVPAPEK